ncbi:MAG: hypothetical protein O2794_02325 [bacterium]|nr:hypothetical protein [bacterium]
MQYFWVFVLLYVLFATNIPYVVVSNVDAAVRIIWAAFMIQWRDPILEPFWFGLIMSVIWSAYLVLLFALTLGRRIPEEQEEEECIIELDESSVVRPDSSSSW